MTKSIFSNLPNNLIMDIIKMAEDQRKKDEEEIRQKHRAKFIDVIHQFNKVEEDMREYYDESDRDAYKSGDDGFILGDLFWTIEQMNNIYYMNENKTDDFDDHYDEDPETYRERSAEWDYNNPDEDAYDWGDEPSWA